MNYGAGSSIGHRICLPEYSGVAIGSNCDEREKLQRASCRCGSFHLVVPVEEEVDQCPVLVIITAAGSIGWLADVERADSDGGGK